MIELKHVVIGGMVVAAALFTCYARAGEHWTEMHIGSRHADREAGYNETNLGLGYMYGVNPHVEVGAGFYKNSEYNQTQYVGGDLHTDTRYPIRVGVSAGMVTGYANTIVMVLPNVTMTEGRVRIKVGWLPGNNGLIALTTGFRF